MQFLNETSRATTSPTTTSSWCRAGGTWRCDSTTTSTCPPATGPVRRYRLVVADIDDVGEQRSPVIRRTSRSRSLHRGLCMGRAAAPGVDTPRAAPSTAERDRAVAQAVAAWRSSSRTAVRRAHPQQTAGGPVSQVHQVMSANPLTLPRVDPATGWNTPVRPLAPVVGATAGVLTKTLALRSTLYAPPPSTTADGSAARENRQRAKQGPPSLLDGGAELVVDTAHRRRTRMVQALQQSTRTLRGRQRGPLDSIRELRSTRTGRRRSRRDVHHPDDDRRRPAAVLRGAGVRRGRPRPRQARLGRRRRAPPARRGAGAGRRRRNGDDRLVVRGHLRVAGRPARRRRRPRVQGELRHGVSPRRGSRTATDVAFDRPARRCSRRASPRRGCTSTRRVPASRT